MSIIVFAIGYGLHIVAFRRGLGDASHTINAKQLKKQAKKNKQKFKTGHSLLDNWLRFGGGYYGIIALIQLFFIELAQVRDFIANWPGLISFIDSLGIRTIIRFFIEQAMNVVSAFIWPTDYLQRYDVIQLAMLIGVTYFVYELARKAARYETSEIL
ncbi:hypothetical protein [Aestuariibacter salexigens]|uniref:hypothetical protein n=1 Tax=Aestuariibacter salexigens TaxID=226010 RepID=UPI0012EC5D1E|nr:hypothetical protein [Aestuariibacter salexigens]